MKRLLLILAAMALCLTGCSTSGTESDSVPAETVAVYQALPLPDLYIEVPDGYQTTSSEFYEEYYVKDDASIIVTEDTSGAPYTSSKDYSITALSQYRSMTHSLELIGDDQVMAGSYGVAILEFRYTLDEKDEKWFTSMVGYMTDGNSMFILTCKSNSETYDSHREEFLSVLRSPAIIKTPGA